jgi:hypothetical protein
MTTHKSRIELEILIKMKTFYFLLIVFVCSTFLNNDALGQLVNKSITVEAVSRGTYNLPMSHNPHQPPYYYLLELKLINKSDKTSEFLTYNCTPMFNMLIDSREYKICSPICPGNSISTIRLKPGQSFFISVIIEKDLQKLEDSIRVGWIYLNYENTTDVDDFHEKLFNPDLNKNYIIWSKKLKLSIFENAPIEIQE